MKTTCLLILLLVWPRCGLAAAAKPAGEEASVVATAEAAMIAKFGSADVDAQRPLRVRPLTPGRAWIVEGSRTMARKSPDVVLVAIVRKEEGGLKASAMKRNSKRAPGDRPERPTAPTGPRAYAQLTPSMAGGQAR